MKKELEVGMYIRTVYGNILKIDESISFCVIYGDCVHCESDIPDAIIPINHIQKASFNIIDLIEVGDYVNEIKVVDNKHSGQYQLYPNGVLHSCHMVDYIAKSSEIKSIVTKEQFKSCEFKIID